MSGLPETASALPVLLRLCCLSVFWAGLAVGAENKHTSTLDALLPEIEKKHGATSTLAAAFEQEKYFSFMTKPVVSKGYILFSAPGKIRFEITAPFGVTLLDDGKKTLRYELVGNSWRPAQFSGGKSMQFVMDQIGQWMQGRFSGQRDVFVLSLADDGDPNSFASLDLTPRHKQFRAVIEKIRVSVSSPPEYDVLRIEIFEPGGDRFSLIFSERRINCELPAACFEVPEAGPECLKLFENAESHQEGRVM